MNSTHYRVSKSLNAQEIDWEVSQRSKNSPFSRFLSIYVLFTSQVLDVSKNSIRNPPSPLEHSTLRILKLAKSGITGCLSIGLFSDTPELPKYMNLPALEELDLSRLYKLHKVPGTLFEGLGNLVKLRIKNNGVKSIPSEITLLR